MRCSPLSASTAKMMTKACLLRLSKKTQKVKALILSGLRWKTAQWKASMLSALIWTLCYRKKTCSAFTTRTLSLSLHSSFEFQAVVELKLWETLSVPLVRMSKSSWSSKLFALSKHKERIMTKPAMYFLTLRSLHSLSCTSWWPQYKNQSSKLYLQR